MWFNRGSDGVSAEQQVRHPQGLRIVVCLGPTCSSRNSAAILAAVERALAARGLGERVRVFTLSCFGHCSKGPNMVVGPRREGWDPILGEAQYFIGEEDEFLYHRLTPAAVEEIVDEHVVRGRPVGRLLGNAAGPATAAGGSED